MEQKKQVIDSQVKGMHLTIFATDSQLHKTRINDLLDNTEMNAVVIDIKEIDGRISIKDVAGNIAYSKNLPSVEQYLKEVKKKGMYAIARIVVFRDNVMPRKKTSLAVKNPDGSLWQDKNNLTWLNPYKQEVIDYILELAEKTADMGFDEIQFDYIRFPSDGKISNCRYGIEHSSTTASKAIINFLKQAKQRLSLKGTKISIDVFGLTTTEKSDMGIGQKIVEMAEQVDYVCPMIYPSHGPKEIQAQIQACYDCEIKTWLLWNAACKYTKAGLKTKENQYSYTKTSDEKIKELLKNKDVDYSIQQRTTKKVSTVKKSTSTVKKSTSIATEKNGPKEITQKTR